MYASETTSTTIVETHGGPVTVTLQKLNWKALKTAARIRHEAVIASATRLSSGSTGEALAAALATRAAELAAKAAVGSRLQTDGDAPPTAEADPALTPAEIAAAVERRYQQYDQETVLSKGIQRIDDKAKRTATAFVDDLDEETADRLHREILDLTLPPIDPASREAERRRFF